MCVALDRHDIPSMMIQNLYLELTVNNRYVGFTGRYLPDCLFTIYFLRSNIRYYGWLRRKPAGAPFQSPSRGRWRDYLKKVFWELIDLDCWNRFYNLFLVVFSSSTLWWIFWTPWRHLSATDHLLPDLSARKIPYRMWPLLAFLYSR